jgi:type II secretory pathway predicted ATPase ExeA
MQHKGIVPLRSLRAQDSPHFEGLPRMYLAHWGLERSPFAAGAAAPSFYEGESQAEALARLRRLAIIVGAPGVGKSLLARRFAHECRREGRSAALVGLTGLSGRELLWQIAAQLALGPRPTDDAASLLGRIAAEVDSLRWQGASAAILLDDAEQAGPDLQLLLARLLALGGDDPRLTLVLTTTPADVWRLGRELLDAADMRIDLEPWTDVETVGYVQHALVEAGCDRPAFDDEALAVLSTLTGGVPRAVTRLADHALLAAAAEGRETVDAAIIEAAHDAVRWESPSLEGTGATEHGRQWRPSAGR